VEKIMGTKNIKVKDLIEALKGLPNQDAVVKLSSDEEGNSINNLAQVSIDGKNTVILWPR
jgi:hypothetical protein